MSVVIQGAEPAAVIQTTTAGKVVFDESVSVPIVAKALTLKPLDQSITINSEGPSLTFFIDPIDPVLPSAIFYDPRNGQYVPLLFRGI